MERRSFFKLVGASAVVAAGGTLAACSAGTGMPSLLPQNQDHGSYTISNDPDVKFTSDVDVLVVGSGIAGLSAAMAPAEAKKSVMIADKLDLLGGESFTSCGIMRVSGSELQRNAGITTTTIEAWDARKQELADAGVSDLEFAKRLFVAAPEWVDHLASEYGALFADPKTYTGAGAPDTVILPKNGIGDMQEVMVPLRDGLSGKGVAFSTGLRAVAFILNEEGICGMRFRAEKNGAISDVRAKRIVLATGGFASSQPLIHAYVPAQENVACYTYASMGEGQLLGQAAGGQLADMEKAAELTGDIPFASAWGMFGPVVCLSPYGKRFAREDDRNSAATVCSKQSFGFWWTVFDKRVADGSQSRSVAETRSKSVKRMVGPCNSLEELATALSVANDTLKATFDAYGKTVDAKKDVEFGRTLFLDKLEPPYFAIRQFPVRYKTRGGIKTDGDGHLLNATGSPIANVYCCGSVGASSVDGLASNGAFGMLVGQAVTKTLVETKAS